MAASDASADDPGSRARLLALVGLALALGAWMGVDALREQVEQRRQQVEVAGRAVLPRAAQSLAALQEGAAAARREREALEAALQRTDPAAYVQARVVHELRQRCGAERIEACSVKYLEDSAARGTATAGAGTSPGGSAARAAAPPARAASASLSELGLAKARALVSGTFQDAEFRRFLAGLLQSSDGGIWKLNALNVRNNTFEIDVELLMRPAAAGRLP